MSQLRLLSIDLEIRPWSRVHVALDVVGSQLDQTVRCVKVDGHAVVIGIVGEVSVNINVFELQQRPLSIRAIEVGSGETLNEMNKAIGLNSHQACHKKRIL